MIQIREAIIVEGRYDKNTLSQIVDATIIETEGFRIFSAAEKVRLLRRIAEKRGVVIFTDSDSAGFLIRNHLKGMLKGVEIKHAYIPDVVGKEKRKRRPSKEGLIGVEGMRPDVIIASLKRAGVTTLGEDHQNTSDPITKADMFMAGLSGGNESAKKRKELMKKLNLPEKLSSNALLQVLNALYTRDEFLATIDA